LLLLTAALFQSSELKHFIERIELTSAHNRPRPSVSPRKWLCPTAVRLYLLAAAVLIAASAEAHPLSLSGFEAWAGESDVRVEFKLDAPSVLAVLSRARPDHTAVPLSAIRGERATIFDYVAARFHIANDSQPCALEPPKDLLVHEAINKVLFEMRFACARPLDVLTIEARLFHEETSTTDVLCIFHYGRALEHYFFNKVIPTAHIPVRQLQQVLPSTVDSARPFEMATPPPGAYANSKPYVPPRRPTGLLHFLWMGVMHILGGLDHVLFVLTLVIAARTRRELILIVSSFTLAHSISLALGTFDLVRASPRLVEPLIAASIVYVAVENVVRRAPPSRPAITFGFGLVHGLGFSEALRELGLPARQLVAPLVGFNLGVEVGQLCIVLPLLPLVILLRRSDLTYRRISLGTNAVVALIACSWFIRRLSGG
jgi:hydrogenase/urease accessory protein HupE